MIADVNVFALPAEYGHEILRAEVGSTLHGTGLGVAHEDHDEMAIYLEWPASTVGLGSREHYTRRSQPEGVRSGPGDTDLVAYSARKYARLALAGNPSVLLPLFAPDDKLLIEDRYGRELRHNRALFVSRRAGRAFLGYMERQRQRLTGDRGRAGRVRSRGECSVCAGRPSVHPCTLCGGTGYEPDPKYMMHMLRLGYQGVELLSTGEITLPVPGETGDYLRAVRQGATPIGEVLAKAEVLQGRMKRLIEGASPLPVEPNRAAVEAWLIGAHREMWSREEDV